MNTEQQTTQNKQHRYTQVNTDIHALCMRIPHIPGRKLLQDCNQYLAIPYNSSASTVAELSSGLYCHYGRGCFRRPEVNQNVTPVMWHSSVLKSV
jgi:hypothetical protein